MSNPEPGDTPDRTQNSLLSLLPVRERLRLSRHFEPVDLTVKSTLEMPGLNLDHVYFPESGVISLISLLEDGSQIEVGLIGNEGFLGVPLVLGRAVSTLEALVQIQGRANRLPAAAFLQVLDESATLRRLMLRYVDFLLGQIVQTAVCNGRHQIEQRLCRWLLMSLDRTGGDVIEVTQGFLSTMLGVQRPGVTLAIGELARANLIVASRGAVHVVDRAGLERAVCECYRVVGHRMARRCDDEGDAPGSGQTIGMPPATDTSAPDV